MEKEKRLTQQQRREQYGELVREMFPPSVDSKKVEELEERKQRLKHPVRQQQTSPTKRHSPTKVARPELDRERADLDQRKRRERYEERKKQREARTYVREAEKIEEQVLDNMEAFDEQKLAEMYSGRLQK